ncbi:MAG: molybdenum cofactor guanylyltransferase [Nitriliruptoraceae bacterium]
MDGNVGGADVPDGPGGAGRTDRTDRADRATVGGAVLAGGRSRRMGQDKAGIEVGGVPLLARTRSALAAALDPGAPVVVVGSPTGPRPGPWIADRRPGLGPLAGLEAALVWAGERGLSGVLVAGVDHPWLEPAVLRLLVDRLRDARPVAAGWAGQPIDAATRVPAARARPEAAVLGTAAGPLLLIGAYRVTTLPVIAGLLDDGERRLQALQQHLDLDVLPPGAWRHLDPRAGTAIDVDDPSALAAAERHLDTSDPGSTAGPERPPG